MATFNKLFRAADVHQVPFCHDRGIPTEAGGVTALFCPGQTAQSMLSSQGARFHIPTLRRSNLLYR